MLRHLAIVAIAALQAFSSVPALAQLHLITGSPTPKHNEKFQSRLYRVSELGAQLVVDITPAGSATDWIGVSVEKGYAVFNTMYPHSAFRILHLSTAAVTKVCVPPRVNAGLIDQWLLDVPGRGLVYSQYLNTLGLRSPLIRSMRVDATEPCERSFSVDTPLDAKYVHSEGQPGIADVVPSTGIVVRLEASGRITTGITAPSEVTFDDIVPSELVVDRNRPVGYIRVNNKDVMAMSVSEGPVQARRQRLLVLRKRDKSWRVLPVTGETIAWVRGFGSFITMTAATVKQPGATANLSGRKAAGPMGPSIHDRLSQSRHVFPGTHYLFDIERGRTYTLATGQSDSEILLVDNGIVYYRTDDKLWQTNIVDNGLAVPKLLTTSDVITDVHWAYIKR